MGSETFGQKAEREGGRPAIGMDSRSRNPARAPGKHPRGRSPPEDVATARANRAYMSHSLRCFRRHSPWEWLLPLGRDDDGWEDSMATTSQGGLCGLR
jgi:hypothetical protein